MIDEQNWHTLEIEDILRSLESGRDGLSKTEAPKRLERFGLNELIKKKGSFSLDALLTYPPKSSPRINQ